MIWNKIFESLPVDRITTIWIVYYMTVTMGYKLYHWAIFWITRPQGVNWDLGMFHCCLDESKTFNVEM